MHGEEFDYLFITDPTAELQIARRKIHELESLNKHIQAEVHIHS